MLAASHRMRRSADFSAALRGRRGGSRCVAVAVDQPSPPVAGAARTTAVPVVGFIVSRAVGGAATRNLVRRRLRHAVAPHLPGLAPGSRVVVRALPPARAASYDELAADLDAALARAGRPVPGSRRSR